MDYLVQFLSDRTVKFVEICQDETRDANRYNRIPFFSRLLVLSSVSQDSDRTGHTD
ncbi:hypothetical protein [Nostoc sp.]|uniref:hypothetical protein n=1 Tax=Nostoc sp. TaxID=1180 RepID=UPI002FF605F0